MKNISNLLQQYIKIIVISVLIVLFSVSSQAQFRYTTNNPNIENFTIGSKILKEDRKISIYKPEIFPEYIEAVPPIIYVLDGEAYINFFASFVNMVCERFVQMPPIIVVSIENFVDGNFSGRERDFTPLISEDSSQAKNTGGADNFLHFIREEVMPFVEKDYKKTPFRVVTGHSRSSFLVLHAFLQYPTLFNAYLASDPAIGMNHDAYLRIADSIIKTSNERNNTLFLNAGMDAWAQSYAGKIDSLLQDKKLKGLSHKYMIYPKETHLTVFLKAYYDGFRFIFNMNPPDIGKKPRDITDKLFEDHYNRLSMIFGYSIKPPEDIINDYGFRFLKDWDDQLKALEFFKGNVESHPKSSNAYNSYGEALLIKGDKINAIINYEKAFQIDPTKISARNIVNKLKREQKQK